jgi:hypothetical protein
MSLEINKVIKREYLTFHSPRTEKIGRVRKTTFLSHSDLPAGRCKNQSGSFLSSPCNAFSVSFSAFYRSKENFFPKMVLVQQDVY